MSSVQNRVSTTNPSSSSAQDHYNHGIPGIPTDGRVVLLKNSNNGALAYLIGTVHVSKQSPETVKKVELCKGRAEGLMNWKPDDDTLSKLFRKSMRAPGGLCMKLEGFICSWWYSRLRAAGKFPGLEFKVAMEESSRVGARCYFINQDIDVTSFDLLMVAFATLLLGSHTDFIYEKCTRAFVRELSSSWKKRRPEEVQDGKLCDPLILFELTHDPEKMKSKFKENLKNMKAFWHLYVLAIEAR